MKVFGSFDEIRDLRDGWDRLAEETGATIHATFDWCESWWRCYGARRKLVIFVSTDAEGLAGVVPMFVERARVGPISLRVAKLLSSDHTIAICDPPVRADHSEVLFTAVLRELLETERCDAVSFGQISAASGRGSHSVRRWRPSGCAAERDGTSWWHH